MSIKHRDLAKAAIYTGFYLETLVQSSLPKEVFDKTYDLVRDNLNAARNDLVETISKRLI